MIEAIGNFINVDNPNWEGADTELIEKLSLDIKPNALSLKLNVNAEKLYNLYFIQYSNKRTHKGRRIYLHYDENHPIVVEPNMETESDDSTEDEFQYQPVEDNPKVVECYIRGDSKGKSFHDMTEVEQANFIATSY